MLTTTAVACNMDLNCDNQNFVTGFFPGLARISLSTIGTLVHVVLYPLYWSSSTRGHLFWCSVPKPAKPAESEPAQAGEAGCGVRSTYSSTTPFINTSQALRQFPSWLGLMSSSKGHVVAARGRMLNAQSHKQAHEIQNRTE